MGASLVKALDESIQMNREKQLMRDEEYMRRLKQQQAERAGPVYDYLKAQIEANCICDHPFRFFRQDYRDQCLALRMEERIKKDEALMYERALGHEMNRKWDEQHCKDTQ